MDKKIRKYLSLIGKRGGAAASGDKKRRSPEHYKLLVAVRAQRRAERAKNTIKTDNLSEKKSL